MTQSVDFERKERALELFRWLFDNEEHATICYLRQILAKSGYVSWQRYNRERDRQRLDADVTFSSKNIH